MMVPYWLLFAAVSPGAFKLYVACLYYGNTSGVRYPSRQTLAKLCGCGPRQVNRYFTELEEAGLIIRSGRTLNGGSQGANSIILNEPNDIEEIATWLDGGKKENRAWLKGIKLDQVPKAAQRKHKAGKLKRVGDKLISAEFEKFFEPPPR
ncbi:MAG: helix-turn-helix domain-containing protein [Planctomycetes bacterium]|nr:helix-turn-helix domain-containing protein [Planctomycetota bacterium]